jgi:hypothetical protein
MKPKWRRLDLKRIGSAGPHLAVDAHNTRNAINSQHPAPLPPVKRPIVAGTTGTLPALLFAEMEIVIVEACKAATADVFGSWL